MANTVPFKATSTDEEGRSVVVEGTVKVYDKPTVKVTITPDGPYYSGDTITFLVDALFDEELGGDVTFFVDGEELPVDAQGRYTWVAP